MLTQADLKAILRYEPETGDFYWTNCRKRGMNGRRAGSMSRPAKHPSHGSYWKILIHGKIYAAHRVAWIYTHGDWPAGEVDHINGDSLDNRITNLRVCDHARNRMNSRTPRNNTVGHKNVYLNKRTGKWVVGFTIDKVRKHFGTFTYFRDAVLMASELRKKFHGEFANHG